LEDGRNTSEVLVVVDDVSNEEFNSFSGVGLDWEDSVETLGGVDFGEVLEVVQKLGSVPLWHNCGLVGDWEFEWWHRSWDLNSLVGFVDWSWEWLDGLVGNVDWSEWLDGHIGSVSPSSW